MKKIFAMAAIVASGLVVSAGQVLAQVAPCGEPGTPPCDQLPGPSVIGLVAVGLVGAIAAAKLRK